MSNRATRLLACVTKKKPYIVTVIVKFAWVEACLGLANFGAINLSTGTSMS